MPRLLADAIGKSYAVLKPTRTPSRTVCRRQRVRALALGRSGNRLGRWLACERLSLLAARLPLLRSRRSATL